MVIGLNGRIFTPDKIGKTKNIKKSITHYYGITFLSKVSPIIRSRIGHTSMSSTFFNKSKL